MAAELNEPTRQMTLVDVDHHPIFNRLWGEEGFVRVNENNVRSLTEKKGLVLMVFADNPTTFKETLDIAVIAPEIAKAFAPYLAGKGFTDPAVGRAISMRFGLTRLPAVGFFRNGVCLGALQGLKVWDDYIKGLAEIGQKQDAPAKRSITIGNA